LFEILHKHGADALPLEFRVHAQGVKLPGVPFVAFDAADPSQQTAAFIYSATGNVARFQRLVDLLDAIVERRPSLGVIALERGDQDFSSLLRTGFAESAQIDNCYFQAAALVRPSRRIASQKSISASTGCKAER
jgi:hypothetical protein